MVLKPVAVLSLILFKARLKVFSMVSELIGIARRYRYRES